MEFGSLKDKVIVVTGGTGILGESFVNCIHAMGGTVVIIGRNSEIANQRAETINADGGNALAVVADVMNMESLESAKRIILEKYGHIDGLVNAAGGNMAGAVIEPEDNLFSLDLEAFSKVLNLNLLGTVQATQVFGEEIAKAKSGSIVNISSMTSQRAITKVMGYSIAKAALDSYTKWFAVELSNRYGDKVRMNAIAPGFFITEQNRRLLTLPDQSYTERGKLVIKQTPFKRFGQPDELEGALIWLLSDASKFVTGTVINVDGGFAAFGGV
ncbi:SDR family oxidoreductase [Pedobacter antarcticus]|uniref:SDR family oxidoreductase n=1 Tax=Pedobacter antarcticus TaxID=34086 RepID=UPI001C56D188|nr:SDR family oxidoreductase [Pedobacter antarcticus]